MRLLAALLSSLGLMPGSDPCAYLPRLDALYGNNCSLLPGFFKPAENLDLSSLILFLNAIGRYC